MWKEFKDFAMKGNLIDTGVAFVLGGAFGAMMTAFVEKCFAPIFGLLTNGISFSDLKWTLKDKVDEVKDAAGVVTTKASPELSIHYGEFLTTAINFFLVALALFMVVKSVNNMKKKEAAAAPPGPSVEQLLTEIRDNLKR